MNTLPQYSDLPELGGLDVRHSWNVLSSPIGTLSFVEPDDVTRAARLVTTGTTIPLNLPINAFDPPLFGRLPMTHTVLQPSVNEAEDLIDSFNPQASSQLDGLAHIRAREFGYFGGLLELSQARERIGIQHVASRGIAARGVLLDLAERDISEGMSPFDGRMYDTGFLNDVAEAQGVEIRAGDVLLIRTGWASSYLQHSVSNRIAPTSWNGLRADETMAAWLWDHRIAAVGADNPAVECAPGAREIGSLHRRLLPALGMSMFELLDLDRLSETCKRLGRWEFFFVSVPLHVAGGVSSPANAMAIL
ncbi:cyclase family protein [Arthrobacter sp. S39]|uniref:cyclase family protein n=1 Tax=Arthrobacter sp. S39 TaxID=2509720 RepID=UPI001037DFE9|nr:cyclase family protein [Arthrobacter sp. S39]TAP39111.1 cyclase family protein [Arthrobacter sp. S39]